MKHLKGTTRSAFLFEKCGKHLNNPNIINDKNTQFAGPRDEGRDVFNVLLFLLQRWSLEWSEVAGG